MTSAEPMVNYNDIPDSIDNHAEGANAVFCDGHAERILQEQIRPDLRDILR